MTATRTQVFDRIIKAMTKLPTGGEDLYMVNWEWKGNKEVYYFTVPAINALVDDILYEHPRVHNYRVAQAALIQEERYMAGGDLKCDDPYTCDPATWKKLREELLDPSAVGGGPLLQRLIALGPNPSRNLFDRWTEPEDIEKVSLGRCKVLVSKFWKTMGDAQTRKNVDTIKKEMIAAIMKDPIAAMQGNGYIYGAVLDKYVLSI